MTKKVDFLIEKKDISSSDDEPDEGSDQNKEQQETEQLPVVDVAPKRKYKFTPARAQALAKGRETRKNKIAQNKAKLEELNNIKENNKLLELAEKVKDINVQKSSKKSEPSSESSSGSDSQIIVKKRKKKVKKKRKQ